MKSTKKCQHEGCKIKLKLTDLNCRCEKRFCSIHRLPESHNCDYDFKKDKIKLIKITTEKINKI